MLRTKQNYQYIYVPIEIPHLIKETRTNPKERAVRFITSEYTHN